MIGIAAAGGVSVGASLVLLVRRERSVQLLALGLMSLALALTLGLAGAPLPGLAVLLLGAVADLVLMSGLSRPFRQGAVLAEAEPPQRRASAVLAGASALAAVAVLFGAGVAGRSALAGRGARSPSIADVGHHLLIGAGVGVLGVLLLVATVLVGMSTLAARDRRELAEEQSEAVRRRRALEQQRRARQREEARAAARAARRGARP